MSNLRQAGGALSTADIGPMHGLALACESGLLILSFCTDCRRMGLMAVEPPLGGMMGEARRGQPVWLEGGLNPKQ